MIAVCTIAVGTAFVTASVGSFRDAAESIERLRTSRFTLYDVNDMARTKASHMVYKYVVPDRIDVLKNNRIRFTQPAALNDPFDVLPCVANFNEPGFNRIREDFEAALGKPTSAQSVWLTGRDWCDPELENPIELQRLFQRLAFLSLSHNRNHLLMWAHYTNAHKGFVIGFDSDSPFFRAGNGKLSDLRRVKYSAKRFVMSSEPNSPQSLLNGTAEFLFFKSKHWAYEKEMRIVADPACADTVIEDPDSPENFLRNFPKCLFAFPRDCVKEVILGWRMSYEHRTTIKEILATDYPWVRLYAVNLDEEKFRLRLYRDDL